MAQIRFTEKGSGYPIVLLHGFPLNAKIWDQFARHLSNDFRVLTPDLPGFGASASLKSPFTVKDVATEIIQWLQDLNISKCVMVGHSLGGYVTLSVARQNPALLDGFVLFHSTTYPDSEEKKENRNKVIDFVRKNGVLAFTSNFIPPLFADQQHSSIENVRAIAITAQTDAVIGYTQAMRDRPDMSAVLKEFHKPIMIISGEKDGGIPVQTVKNQASLSEDVTLHVLTDVAHMGMFEEPAITSGLIRDFVDKSNRH